MPKKSIETLKVAAGADARLTAIELQVVQDARAGVITDLGSLPTSTEVSDRSVRAEVLRGLFLERDSAQGLTVLGLRVRGARIVGALDLGGLSASGGGPLPPLDLSGCRFDTAPKLAGVRLDSVRLDGSALPGLDGEGMVLSRGLSGVEARCAGRVFLDNCRIAEGVCLNGMRGPDGGDAPCLSLNGATLGGDLTLNRVWLSGRLGASSDDYRPALDLDGANIRHLELVDAAVIGVVTGQAVRIAVQFNAADAQFASPFPICLWLDGAEIGEVFLDRARVTGAVRAAGSVVKRIWSANGAVLSAESAVALCLDDAEIGTVSLIAVTARGEVRATRAMIRGAFEAPGGSFINPGGEALNLAGAQIGGVLNLRDGPATIMDVKVDRPVRMEGQLDLTQAKVGGDLALEGLILRAAGRGIPAGVAVDARELEVKGSLWWTVSQAGRRPAVEGVVNLGRADVHGAVDLTGLFASHATPGITDHLDPRGTYSRLDLAGVALAMPGMAIGGSLTVGRATAQVRPTSPAADVDSDLAGRAWTEQLGDEEAEATTEVMGCFDLSRASLNRDLLINGATFTAIEPEAERSGPAERGGRRTVALSLHGATIGKALSVKGLVTRPDRAPLRFGLVDLRSARCDDLDDGRGGAGWGEEPDYLPQLIDGVRSEVPRGYRLDLDGFEYARAEDDDGSGTWSFLNFLPARLGGCEWGWSWLDPIIARFSTHSPTRNHLPLWSRRERWLRRQYRRRRPAPDDYSPQPWNEAVSALRAAGRDDDARRLTMAHYDFRRESGVEPFFSGVWSWLVGVFFRYGYSPLVVAFWLGLFVLLGAGGVTYWQAHDLSASTPPAARILVAPPGEAKTAGASEEKGPCAERIVPPLYAIDIFLPVNLKEQERCELNPRLAGWRWARAIYVLLGWVFTPLAALTWAGVLKRQ